MGFAAPLTNQSGDSLAPGDILGQLVVAIGTEFIPSIPTEFGDSAAIRADVAVLTEQNEDGSYGVVYRDILWFNVSLRNTLKKQIGQAVLARMGQGEKQPGKNAPFILIDATQDQQAVQFAEGWMDAHPDFEAEAKQKINESGKVAAPAAAPAPSVPVAAAIPTTPAIPAAPVATPAPAPAAGPDLSALAALPAEQQQALLAQLMANQA